MTSREVVWSWDGPPRLQLLRVSDVPPDRGRALHALVVQGGRPGAVVVARHERSILFVEHDRPLVGEVFLELPRGFGDDADGAADDSGSPARTGVRELREETGYGADSARIIGRYRLDTGLVPGDIEVVEVRVTNLRRGETDDEVRGSVWIHEQSLPDLVREGRLRDAHTLAALAFVLQGPLGH